MSNQASEGDQEQILESVEILESHVLESRVHNIIDNPTDAVIAEG